MGANKRLNWLSAAFSGMGLDGGMNLSAVFSGMGLERLMGVMESPESAPNCSFDSIILQNLLAEHTL